MGIKLMMAKSASNMFVSSLFLLSPRLSGSPSLLLHLRSDFVPLVNLISILFQIRDDYMNLQSSQVRFSLRFSIFRRRVSTDLSPTLCSLSFALRHNAVLQE